MPPNRDFATRTARRAPRASRTTHLLAFAFALASSQRGAARAEDGLGWREGGTATWYGGPNGPGPDGMSIYTGSCKYGSNIPSHYVAALNTDGTLNTDAAAWNFNSENINCAGGYDHGLTDECGACYEVMCVAGRQRGLADSVLGPWAGCANGDGEKSITVLITDSCPCGHPNPSNQRWCCGGEQNARHFDLSYAAFDSIAIRHRGIVDVKYRKVSCDGLGQEKYYA